MKRWMRAGLTLFASMSLATGGSAAAAAARDAQEAPLYRWDGTGYTTQQVPYSPHGNSAPVMIPVDFEDVKHEFRSAWVATTYNLHFPQTSGQEAFTAQYAATLKNFAAYNMNAMLFQVRPEQDAWYPSKLGNPWSKYVTGPQEGVDPGFDPLEIMVSMTHEAGMEYHAWFNPYRVTNRSISALRPADIAAIEAAGFSLADLQAATPAEHVRIYAAAGLLAPDNFAVQHPDWVLSHGTRLFLNPGVPQVQQHIIDTVAEVFENYPVDAIHFDDYFYPSGFGAANSNPATAADGAQFKQFGQGFPNTTQGLNDWRRSNTDALVEGVHEAISTHNALHATSVQFGISPAGIWNHKGNDPLGSYTPTGSQSSYLQLYCDTYKWIKHEWLDYVMPQIYWGFATSAAPYGELARWWNSITEGTKVQIYVGQALYQVGEGAVEWSNPGEIPNQLRFNQTLSSVWGSGFYSYQQLLPARDNATLTRTQRIIKDYWSYTALVPPKEWLSHGVSAPRDVVLDDAALYWKSGDVDTSQFFIIYRGDGTPEQISSDPRNIVGRVYAGAEANLVQPLSELGAAPISNANYVVTATNAAGVESAPVAASSPSAQFKVTFDPRNGEDPFTVGVPAGERVETPTAPVRDGYEFRFWSKSPQSDLAYDFDATVTANFKLYAHWKPLVPVEAKVRRLGGADRYGTNRAVNAALKPKQGGTVFVATGAVFPDSLSAAPAAAITGGALFLTAPKSVPAQTLSAIKDLHPTKIYIIGGGGAVSEGVATQLRRATGTNPVRVAGANRYETSAKVFQTFFSDRNVPQAFVATGTNYADSLSASAAAGAVDAPVLLVNGIHGASLLPQSTELLKQRGGEKIFIVGGRGAVNPTIEGNLKRSFKTVKRLEGVDRYETNMAVNEHVNSISGSVDMSGVWIATGANFPDALSAAPAAGHLSQRLVLSNGKCVPAPVVSQWIRGEGATVETVSLVGGEAVLPQAIMNLTQCK